MTEKKHILIHIILKGLKKIPLYIYIFKFKNVFISGYILDLTFSPLTPGGPAAPRSPGMPPGPWCPGPPAAPAEPGSPWIHA